MEIITLIFCSMGAAIIFAIGMSVGATLAIFYYTCQDKKTKKLRALEGIAKEYINKVDNHHAQAPLQLYNKLKAALTI